MVPSSLLLLFLVALMACAFVLAFALASVAKRADEHGRWLDPMNRLCTVRSPTGKPFFPTRQSVEDLTDALDGVVEQTPPYRPYRASRSR